MSLEKLRARFRGQIVQAGNPGYDDARKVYNGMIDRRPRVIARCADASDVMAAASNNWSPCPTAQSLR